MSSGNSDGDNGRPHKDVQVPFPPPAPESTPPPPSGWTWTRKQDFLNLSSGPPSPNPPPPDDRGAPGSLRPSTSVSDAHLTRKVTNRRAKKGDTILSAVTPRSVSNQALSLDLELSKENWESVYSEYQHSGDPIVISEHLHSALSPAQVKHLIEYGVLRLGLPPIAEHACDYDRVNLALSASVGTPSNLETHEVDGPVRQAVTERVTQEAAAARRALDAAVEANEIFSGYLHQLSSLARAGRWELPEGISIGLLEKMTKALLANTTSVEHAVKLTRLTQGEPTETISIQVAGLLANCTLEELQEAERTGRLPGRLNQSRIIDIPGFQDPELRALVEPPQASIVPGPPPASLSDADPDELIPEDA